MQRIELTTRIFAPRERCFDLSRSVDVHVHSTAHTGETIVAGRSSGLLTLGEEVTWRARHFGIRQTLTSRITAYDRPSHFRDSMVRGAFAGFDHDHHFIEEGSVTLMRDIFAFAAPFGVLGAVVERLVLRDYLRRLLERRNAEIKELAESDGWRRFVSDL